MSPFATNSSETHRRSLDQRHVKLSVAEAYSFLTRSFLKHRNKMFNRVQLLSLLTKLSLYVSFIPIKFSHRETPRGVAWRGGQWPCLTPAFSCLARSSVAFCKRWPWPNYRLSTWAALSEYLLVSFSKHGFLNVVLVAYRNTNKNYVNFVGQYLQKQILVPIL